MGFLFVTMPCLDHKVNRKDYFKNEMYMVMVEYDFYLDIFRQHFI